MMAKFLLLLLKKNNSNNRLGVGEWLKRQKVDVEAVELADLETITRPLVGHKFDYQITVPHMTSGPQKRLITNCKKKTGWSQKYPASRPYNGCWSAAM